MSAANGTAESAFKKALFPVYRIYEGLLERSVKENEVPSHIGIIMDGNRRAAQLLGLKPAYGHKIGAEKVEEFIEWCIALGIKHITLFAFSTENFARSEEEKNELFRLFEKYFIKVAGDEKIHKSRVKIKVIGRLDMFPESVKSAVKKAEEATKNYDNLTLNVALGYGGREEVIQAVKKIAQEVKDGKLGIEGIDGNAIRAKLYTAHAPDPELIIRTSGEERISNFLLWQSAYSELYFCESFWPVFRKIDFLRAIRTFQQRQRRFGK